MLWLRLTVVISCFLSFTFAYAERTAENQQPLQLETSSGDHLIRHVVFNSSFIQPDVARAYGLKRSKYESLLNISVYKKNSPGTIPAKLQGTITNLMQQQKSLRFITVEEKNAIYYLAPLSVGNEEVVRFEISVTPDGSDTPINVNFSQTIYADE